MNFNPEFHWQKEVRKQNEKKTLKILLIVFVLVIFGFLVLRRCHFVSYLNMNLDYSIPSDAKVVLHISEANKILSGNKYGFKSVDSLKKSFEAQFKLKKKNVESLFANLGKNIYWIENGNNSQAILLNINGAQKITDFLSQISSKKEDVDFDGKKIQTFFVGFGDNKFISTKDGSIYVYKLNNYAICVSNDIELLKRVIEKNKKDGKLDYINSAKDEISGYFKDVSIIDLSIENYDEIANSQSWIKNLSSIYHFSNQNKLFAKMQLSDDGVNIVVNGKEKDFAFEEISNSYNTDLYYGNFGTITSGADVVFGENLDQYLSSKIETPYSVDIKKQISNLGAPFAFLSYKDKDFVLIGSHYDKIEDIYKSIFSRFFPSKRVMRLPDKTIATEYFANPSAVALSEREENGAKWKYVENHENEKFYLANCNNVSILSNSREKIKGLCANNDEIQRIITRSNIKELFEINLENNYEFLPFAKLFYGKYKRFDFVNWSDDGGIKALFELKK